MLLDFRQIKNGAQVLSQIQKIRQDLDKTMAQEIEVPQEDVFEITNAEGSTETFTLSKIPNARAVSMFMNGVCYNENEDFIIANRNNTGNEVTWQFTKANGGFDISTEVTNKVIFKYFVNDRMATSSDGTISLGDYTLSIEEG